MNIKFLLLIQLVILSLATNASAIPLSLLFNTKEPEPSLYGYLSSLANMQYTVGDMIYHYLHLSPLKLAMVLCVVFLTIYAVYTIFRQGRCDKNVVESKPDSYCKRIMLRANTPTKRVGLIALVASSLLLIGTPIHFNFKISPFFYWQYNESLIQEVPEPESTHVGYYWENQNTGRVGLGWFLKEKPCPLINIG